MSRPRRQQPKKPVTAAPDWSALGNCPACGKKIYPTKKAAKTAARIKHPNDQMSAYQCRSKSPKRPNPAPWHFGHLDEKVKKSEQSRTDLYEFGAARLREAPECGYVDKEGTGLKCSLPPNHGKQPHLAKNALDEWVNISPEVVPPKAKHVIQEMTRVHRAARLPVE